VEEAGGANVTFKVVEPSQAGGGATTGGPPILSIMRQVPRDQGATVQGETRGWSFNGSRGDTFMDINPGVTNDTAVIHVVSHELGHTFGLKDCGTCAQGSTAMTLPQSPDLNAAGGHNGPTTCDSRSPIVPYANSQGSFNRISQLLITHWTMHGRKGRLLPSC